VCGALNFDLIFLDLFSTDVCFYGGNDYSQLHRKATTDRTDQGDVNFVLNGLAY
jgi:hypothetical protein